MDITTLSKEELVLLKNKYQKRLDEISKPDAYITTLREAYALSKEIEKINNLLK